MNIVLYSNNIVKEYELIVNQIDQNMNVDQTNEKRLTITLYEDRK
jgi:hypothetical protein